jgi:prepilin-type N-terminal cleavage/methylation domain-containing protein
VALMRIDRSMEGTRGVTLIELVAALSLSALVVAMALALYKDVGTAASLLRGRDAGDFSARALFSALSENVLAGGGILSLGDGHLSLVNPAGLRTEYRWEDSTLTVNGHPWPIRLAAMEIRAFGPVLPDAEGWSRERMEHADVDTLDDDRDGRIDHGELDRDRSGELDAWECRYVAGLSIRMETVREGVAKIDSVLVHPRNRAKSWTENAADRLPGIGDFGL